MKIKENKIVNSRLFQWKYTFKCDKYDITNFVKKKKGNEGGGEVLIIHNENPNVIIWLVKLIVIRLFPFIIIFFFTINIYRYNQNIIIDVYFHASIIQGQIIITVCVHTVYRNFFFFVIMKICFYNYIYIILPVHRICHSHWPDVIITSDLI